MSGTTLFSTYPRGTQVRMAAVAVIKSQATLAGLAVYDNPLDPVPENAEPRVNVYCNERRDGIGLATILPTLQVRYTLMVQCLTVAALPADAVMYADILKQQVLEALFGDPNWPKLLGTLQTVEEKREHSNDGERYVTSHQINILGGWKEAYDARPTSVLNGSGFPGRPAPIILPLTGANNTIVAGNAPGANGQGTTPTEFSLETPLTPP